VVHFIRHWATRTGLSVVLLVGWLGIALSKFSRWSRRLGRPNHHNGRIPRDFGLEEEEKTKILAFHDLHPLEGQGGFLLL
jgi:putative transposase